MPDDTNVKDVIDRLGTTFEEFKKAHDEEIKEIKKKGSADPVLLERMGKMDAQLDLLSDIQANIAKAQATADAAEKAANRPGLIVSAGNADYEEETRKFNLARVSDSTARGRPPEPPVGVAEVKAYSDLFPTILRQGKDSYKIEQKALQVGIDPDGGFVVPPTLSNKIIEKIYETSEIRAISDGITISSDRLEGLMDRDEAGFGGWVSETAPRPTTSTPQLGKWQISVHEMYANPPATQQILDDAAMDIAAWLTRKVAERFAREENKAFVYGNGIGKPRGFASYTTVTTDDATRPWGSLQHFVTGVNGGFATTFPSDRLFDVMGGLKSFYLANARWVTTRVIVTAMRKFRDGQGQYLWIPGLISGATETLLGFPITKLEDLPPLSDFANSLWFGDFKRGYLVVDRIGIRVLRDPYTLKPYVLFYTTKRVGGDVQDFEAIKALRFST